MYSIIFSIFLSSFALASNWSQLSLGKTYILNQNFRLAQFEQTDFYVDFNRGEKFTLISISPLDIPGVPVELFKFDYKNCPSKKLVTELEIISVRGSTPVVEVGAEVVDCELLIYIERKDIFYKSIFLNKEG